MLMEAQAQEIPSNGRSSAAKESSKEPLESTLEEKPGSQDASCVPPAHPQRNLPGTKDESLIRQDPHNVDRLITLPPGQDDNSWLYEHLCQICLELNYLIVHLEPECTPEVCPEMRAEEWMYYCATHRTPRECCAIDYLTHTLDGASALLNNVKFFPSRICVPEGSVKNFQSIARRLYRIFAHAYFHHRDIFDAFEAETSLYERFLKLSRSKKMITEKLIIIPGNCAEEESPSMGSRQIMSRSRDT
ncbi:hypothetical protein BGZ67_001381 [Mortierella alpina]|nr:hypothetical protein BGZ67_001381 [Mortierella alpina]